ncbi:MAG: serine/threonine-protein kinase [bacterium]
MSTPSPSEWSRIESLFDEAVGLPPDQREAYVTAAEQDPRIRDEVHAMLRADAREGILERSVGDVAADFVPPDPDETLAPGTEIPPYRIVRPVGAGGMGTVYLAERADGQFDQQVALKLIRSDRNVGAIRTRFLQERQILANLDHPNIAKLLDGGITGDGRPYFALEYVEGSPITRYADEQRLGVDERVDLFRKVCAAVAYAQQRLVVHRDLKPSNILVTPEGEPKLLDFGIAKLFDPDQRRPDLTQEGTSVFTPEYAAPEQVRGEGITTATDVYALGGILYELLSGALPLTPQDRSLVGWQRAILEAEPAPITRALARTPERERAEIAARRRLSAAGLSRRLRGDLTNVVEKSLRKEADRRYASAAELLEDLDAFRRGLPVRAAPPSLTYRARKYVARNRLAVAAAGAVALALIGGAVATSWQAQRAEQAAERATGVTRFLVSLFEDADPNAAPGREITARELLDRGAARLDTELVGDAQSRSELLRVVGGLYDRLGEYPAAEELHERALESRLALHGPDHPLVAESLGDLGRARLAQSRYGDADSLFRRALTIHEAAGADAASMSRAYADLGSAAERLGELAEAADWYERSRTAAAQAHGPRSAEVARALQDLALVQRQSGALDDAQASLREALAIYQEVRPAVHSDIAEVLHGLAWNRHVAGDREEAERLSRESVEMRRRLYPNGHPELAIGIRNLGTILRDGGDLDQAEALFRESLAMTLEFLGEDHVEVASAVNDLAIVSFIRQDLATAQEQLRRARALYERHLPADHARLLTIDGNLAVVALRLGQSDEAARTFERLVDVRTEKFGAAHPDVAYAWIGVGNARAQGESWPEAREAYERALSIYRELYGEDHVDTAVAKRFLARAVGEEGDWDSATRCAAEAHAFLSGEYPETHRRVAEAAAELGRAHLESGRRNEATPLLASALSGYEAAFGVDDARTREVAELLARSR